MKPQAGFVHPCLHTDNSVPKGARLRLFAQRPLDESRKAVKLSEDPRA